MKVFKGAHDLRADGVLAVCPGDEHQPYVDDWYYAVVTNFDEFVRLELWDGRRAAGRFWFRVSDYLPWHFAMVATFKTIDGKWHDGHPDHLNDPSPGPPAQPNAPVFKSSTNTGHVSPPPPP